MNVDRAEHIAWCKQRALSYLPDNPLEAITSMFSDLGKHPETKDHGAIALGVMLLMAGHLDTEHKARSFIEGFN